MSRSSDMLVMLRVGHWGVQVPLVSVVVAAYGLAAGLPAVPVILRFGLTTGVCALLLSGGYLINDYCDRAADRQAGGRPAGAFLRPRLYLGLGLALVGAGLVAAFSVFPRSEVRVIVVLQVAGGLAYSLPWPRLKERGTTGLAASAVLQRLPFFLIVALGFPLQVVGVIACGAWLVVVGLVFIVEHQIDDLAADRRTGVRTWATTAGLLTAQWHRHRLYRVYGGLTAGTAVTLAVVGGRPGVAGAALFAAGAWWLRRLAWQRYLANRRLPRRDLPPPRSSRPVVIRGGGLAGLVAAIKLASWGHRVEVQDRPTAATAAESVHAVRCDPAFVARHLDLPLAACFAPVAREILLVAGRPWRASGPHWVCRRGSGPQALDTHLTRLASENGVRLIASGRNNPDHGSRAPDIMATGLSARGFTSLGLPHDLVGGWWAVVRHEGPNVLFTSVGPHTHPNYGYAATCGGLAYALIFSRHGILPAGRDRFAVELQDHAGLTFKSWQPLVAAVPRVTRLTHGSTVLAGTLAGMMDPFWYSGVTAALVSGGVAALSRIAPDLARAEHDYLTRKFGLQRGLADLARRVPWHLGLIPWAVNGIIEPVGSVGWCCRNPGPCSEGEQDPVGVLQDDHAPSRC